MNKNNKVKSVWLFNNTTGCKFKCNIKSPSNRLMYWLWKNVNVNNECADCDDVDPQYLNDLRDTILENLHTLVSSISSEIPVDIEIQGPRQSWNNFWYDYKVIIHSIKNIKLSDDADIKFHCVDLKLFPGSIHCIVEITLPFSCTVEFKDAGGRVGFMDASIDAGLSGTVAVTTTPILKFNIFISLPKQFKKECGMVTQICSVEFLVDKWDIIGTITEIESAISTICNSFGLVVCEAAYGAFVAACQVGWVECNVPCEAGRGLCEVTCCGPFHFCSCDDCRGHWRNCENDCNNWRNTCLTNAENTKLRCKADCLGSMQNLLHEATTAVIKGILGNVIDAKLIPYLTISIEKMAGEFLGLLRIPYVGGTVADCKYTNNIISAAGIVKTNIGKDKRYPWLLSNRPLILKLDI